MSGQQNPSFFPRRAGRGGGPAPPQTDRQPTCKCRDGPWSACVCVCVCTRMWCGLVCGVRAVRTQLAGMNRDAGTWPCAGLGGRQGPQGLPSGRHQGPMGGLRVPGCIWPRGRGDISGGSRVGAGPEGWGTQMGTGGVTPGQHGPSSQDGPLTPRPGAWLTVAQREALWLCVAL